MAEQTSWPDAHEVAQFLYREAYLLDHPDRWDEWLELFAEDGVYWVPYSRDHMDPQEQPSIQLEDKMLIEVHLLKLREPTAWSQQPSSRTARVVSNVFIEPDEPAEKELIVRSTFNLTEFYRDRYYPYAGHYTHRLRATPDGLRIVQKRVDLINGDGLYEKLIQLHF